MNKKIKIIELYNKVVNNENLPKQIKWEGMIWNLDVGRDYISETNRTLGSDVRLDELNEYVEILEDNTEEIEDIEEIDLFDNGQGFNDIKIIIQSYDRNFQKLNDVVNKIGRAVNQLRKDKSNE